MRGTRARPGSGRETGCRGTDSTRPGASGTLARAAPSATPTRFAPTGATITSVPYTRAAPCAPTGRPVEVDLVQVEVLYEPARGLGDCRVAFRSHPALERQEDIRETSQTKAMLRSLVVLLVNLCL